MKPWLIAGIQRLVVPPRLVTGKILQQMHPHILILRADQPQPQQKGAEGERRIIPDGRFPELRVLLVNTLRRDRHSQNDVGFRFTRVQRRVEQSPLNCAMVEHGMQVPSLMLSST